MSRRAGNLIAFGALALVAMGCGGGGGSKSPANPVAMVQAREAALGRAYESENLDQILQFYAETWTNGAQWTKADLRSDLEGVLPLIEFVDMQQATSYLASNDNVEVIAGGGGTVRFRVEETGQIVSVGGTGETVWRKIGEDWYVVFTESTVAIQNALRRQRPAP